MSRSSHSILSIHNLTHRYGPKLAISDITLDFEPSKIYGLLGSNGAGKSTTMNIMCGVLKPTSGEVVINGIALSREPEKAKRELGFLPQKPPLHTELTVKEFLRYTAGLRQINNRRIKYAVDEVIESCMLKEYANKLISSLSGGYQQRVGIAQAIIHKPSIVIFDEPTNGLDPNQTEIIRALIKDIAKERTVVLSTHILPEVQATCQHICMIEKGNLVFNGTVEQFTNYIKPNSIIVSFANTPEIESLKTFNSTKSVEALGSTTFRITFQGDGTPLIDDIVSTSVHRGWLLREIRLEKNSPEKVFSAISKQQLS